VSIEAIEKELGAGTLRPVYLIVGEEGYTANELARAVREAVLRDGVPGLNDDQFQAHEIDVDGVLSAAKTLPMLAKRRFVSVRGIERWESRDAKALERLTDYFERPVASTTLVLVASKLDKRRRFFTAARSRGFVFECAPLAGNELCSWVARRVEERGVAIEAGAEGLIVELAGPALAPVADAVERLCLFVGPAGTIDEEAVLGCLIRLRTTSVWELVGAVGRRDAGKALAALADVFDPQDRGLRLLGVLAWSARQLLRFQAATVSGATPAEAARAAGAPPFKARELAQQVRATPRDQLERWVEVLAALDLALKGGDRRPPRAVLEDAILRMCATVG
jgi:DNA polymerase-3 subunit delta